MNAPRLEIDLEAVTHNTRTLVSRLMPLGIAVTGITKASLGSPGVAAAMLRGGAGGVGDSRIENLARLSAGGIDTTTTLIRSPMVSQAALVVRHADISLNTEAVVIDSLAAAAVSHDSTHGVVVMVELGDLREGVPVGEVLDLCRHITQTPGVQLAGLGTNLACQSGVVPDQVKMDELSRLVEKVETGCNRGLSIVSGGNSANLDWALSTADAGHVNDLRLGEAILLGTEPLHRRVVDGLRTDAFTLFAEVIEVKTKPALPWGDLAQGAFGTPPTRHDGELVRQAIVALGRQDTDPDGLTPPAGITVLGMSSDHLVLDVGDHGIAVGDEIAFGLGYGALLRAATSPFVAKLEKVHHEGLEQHIR
jgi:predicted amino acid racemase